MTKSFEGRLEGDPERIYPLQIHTKNLKSAAEATASSRRRSTQPGGLDPIFVEVREVKARGRGPWRKFRVEVLLVERAEISE